MCSVFPTCAEPWNITCSNRWAKPVFPLTSCFEPTLYQTFTAATGARWSSEMISRRPLGRRVCVKSTLGTGTDSMLAATPVGPVSKHARAAPLERQHQENEGRSGADRRSLEDELHHPPA